MCKDRYSVLSHALIIMEYDVATHKKGKNKRTRGIYNRNIVCIYFK